MFATRPRQQHDQPLPDPRRVPRVPDERLDPHFALPSVSDPSVWDEFEPWCKKIDRDSAEVVVTKSGCEPLVMAERGVERLDEWEHDATSSTVGLWLDKNQVLRGATRLRLKDE